MVLKVTQLLLLLIWHLHVRSSVSEKLWLKPCVIRSSIACRWALAWVCLFWGLFCLLLEVSLNETLSDDALHRLDISLVHQVEHPCRDAVIRFLGAYPHQELVSAVELDERVRLDWGSTVWKLAGLVDYVDQVLLLAVFCCDFIDTKEETFFDQEVLFECSIILEEVTEYLNQSLLDLQPDVTWEFEVFLTDLQILHLCSKLLLSILPDCLLHLTGLLGLLLLFLLSECETCFFRLLCVFWLRQIWLIRILTTVLDEKDISDHRLLL